ncbi:MAG: hypothetical protein AAGC46_20795 [Solirubrobacteraceae bacterium]|nr:hypothetical protein [Patulibacter sp.]
MPTVALHPSRAVWLGLLLLAIFVVSALHAWVSPASAATSPKTKLTALHAGISYQGGQGTMPVWTDIRVSITRNGEAVLTKAALPTAVSKSFYKAPLLQVFDFDDDAEPEVMIDVATIGGDCCKRSVIYHHTATGYDSTVVDWGTATYTLKNVVGGVGPEFVTTDPRLPEAFKSKATGPLRILQFDHGALSDVTAKAKALVTRDARKQKRAWKKAHGASARAPLAAYVVDLIRLRKPAVAKAAIRTAAKKKQLAGASASSFAKSLDTRAVRFGYFKRAMLG